MKHTAGRALLPTLMLPLLLAACESPTDPEPLPGIGDLLQLNVEAESTCDKAVMRTGRVVSISNRAIVLADTNNPPGGFSDAEYAAFGTAFDNLVWPVDTRAFGEPSDVDRNERVLIFFTSSVNNLTTGSDETILGFHFGRDLFPKENVERPRRLTGCAGSNEAEMFYMRVPDPGRAGFSKEQVERLTVGTLAHEFQHLINGSRRLYVNNASAIQEEVWLNEGLSHIAEELVFYESSGLAPRQNLDDTRIRSSTQTLNAFNRFAIANFGRLASYLRNPQGTSLINGDELATRGAGWAFLRYAADRKGGSDTQLWQSLANSRSTGLVNLREVLAQEPLEWMQDWTVAVYADDAVSGVDAARFTQPSWNFRSVLPLTTSARTFPLQTLSLGSGTPVSLTLRADAAAFLRFRVAAGARADVRTTSGGVALPGACAAPATLAVGGVLTVPAGSAGHICVSGGTEGAEFTLVPFFASETKDATTAVQIAASGVLPAAGPPNPSLVAADVAKTVAETSFEQRLRERELRDLTPRVAGAASFSASPGQASSRADLGVRMSLIRTK